MWYLLSWAVWVLKHAFDQTFAPAPRFNVDSDIPDLKGKVVLVTGGNTGIGYELCLTSLRKGAKVYMACRSEEKAREAIDRLRETLLTTTTSGIDVDIHFLPLDLSSLSSIHTSTTEFLEKEERLDVLFCNAGVMVPDRREITKEGYDMQFGVNVLGHHVLVGLLKPALVNTQSTSASHIKNRIVMLSSIGHTLFPPWYTQAFVPSLTVPGPARDGSGSWWALATGGIGSWGLYGHSKMGNILSARWFQKELGDSVVVTACHPGLISTELYRTTPSFLTLFTSPLSKPPSYGALTPLYLGFSPETSTSASGGRYYVPWAREVPGSLDVRARGEEGMRQAEVLDRWVGECVRKWEAESGGRSNS